MKLVAENVTASGASSHSSALACKCRCQCYCGCGDPTQHSDIGADNAGGQWANGFAAGQEIDGCGCTCLCMYEGAADNSWNLSVQVAG